MYKIKSVYLDVKSLFVTSTVKLYSYVFFPLRVTLFCRRHCKV